LADALLDPAAVEAIGDEAVLLVVLVEVGVEEVERDAADVGLPDARVHRGARDLDGDPDVLDRPDGHRPRVESGEALLLPAPRVERLAEVAVVVEEADRDERQADVVGRFEVVAGEHPESAGVLGQRGGHAELGGEVGHRLERPVLLLGPQLEPAGLVERALELVGDRCGQRGEGAVLGEGVEVLLGFDGQHAGRVAHDLPVLTIHATEQVLGPFVVDPPQVHGHLAERLERFGQVGHDGERLHGLHGG
jgi:hypothetical protein